MKQTGPLNSLLNNGKLFFGKRCTVHRYTKIGIEPR